MSNLDEWSKMMCGFCDKQYRIGFKHPIYDDIVFVKGEMINYHGGNVILANDEGVWHIPYNAIKWVLPIKKEK